MSDVKFRPIEANIKAPDFTKAGSVFSAALNKIGAAAAQLRQNPIGIAIDDLTNQVRGAESTEDLAQFDTSIIAQRGGSPEEIQAAENQLTGRGLDLFGNEQQDDFFTDRSTNVTAIKNAAEGIEGVTIDKGNNPRFATPEVRAEFISRLQQPGSGFSPVPSTQKRNANIRQRVIGLGGTQEDVQREIAAATTRAREVSTLDENQQAQVASADSAVDRQVQLDLDQADFKLQNRFNSAGQTSEQAQEQLNLSRTELFKILNGTSTKGVVNWGEELGFFANFFTNKVAFQDAGIDIKERVTKYLRDSPNTPPWMILEALNETIDTDKGAENIDTSDFLRVLKRLTDNPEFAANLNAIANLEANTRLEKIAINQRADLQKGANLASFRANIAGITNVERNAALFNSRAAQAVGEPIPQPPEQGASVAASVGSPAITTTNPNVVTPAQVATQAASTIRGSIGSGVDTAIEAVSLAAEVLPSTIEALPTALRLTFDNAVNFVKSLAGSGAPTTEAAKVATDITEDKLKEDARTTYSGTIDRSGNVPAPAPVPVSNRAKDTTNSPPISDRVFRDNPNVGGADPEVALQERLTEEAATAAANTPEALRAVDDAFTDGLKKARERQSKKAKEQGEKAVTFVKDLLSNVWAALGNKVRSNSSPQMIAFLDGAEKETVPVASEAEIENPQSKLIRDRITAILDSIKGSGRPLTAVKQIEMLQLRLGLLIADGAAQQEIQAVTQMTNELILKIK